MVKRNARLAKKVLCALLVQLSRNTLNPHPEPVPKCPHRVPGAGILEPRGFGRRLEDLEQPCSTLTTANTHGDNAPFCLPALALE